MGEFARPLTELRVSTIHSYDYNAALWQMWKWGEVFLIHFKRIANCFVYSWFAFLSCARFLTLLNFFYTVGLLEFLVRSISAKMINCLICIWREFWSGSSWIFHVVTLTITLRLMSVLTAKCHLGYHSIWLGILTMAKLEFLEKLQC